MVGRAVLNWWFALFGFVASLVISFIEKLVLGPAEITRHVSVIGGIPLTVTLTSNQEIGTVWSLILLCPQLAVGFRRLHDVNRSAWWGAVPIPLLMARALCTMAKNTLDIGGLSGLLTVIIGICFIGAILMIVLLFAWLCERGTVGDNRFGPDPFAVDPL